MDHLALIGREAKQPCLYRFAQQPLSCLVHPLRRPNQKGLVVDRKNGPREGP